MTIGIGIFAFDLALPFDAGGMDASGFTVAPGTPQGMRSDMAELPPPRWTGSLATCLWIGAISALLR